MLRLYRRHRVSCSHHSEQYRRCQCPIYVKGTLGGASIRQSLDQVNWDAASTVIASWVESGRINGTLGGTTTIAFAVEAFTADIVSRGLSKATIKKYRLLLRRLITYYEQENSRLLTAVTLHNLSQFRATWPGGALNKSKTQERLKAFFGWCQKRAWIADNPASGLSVIKVPAKPTLPFTTEEWERILNACDLYPTLNKYRLDNRARMRAMVLLLRWSGLRIQDAVTLERQAIHDDTLFLYTQKTGTPVLLPLPPECVLALNQIYTDENPRIFWHTGNGTPENAVSNWGRALRRLFRLAEVVGGHPHRFRDTFAVELLLQGVPLEDVSILLGHSSIKVTQASYAPWVAARQSRLEASVRASWGDGGSSPAPTGSDIPVQPHSPVLATTSQV